MLNEWTDRQPSRPQRPRWRLIGLRILCGVALVGIGAALALRL